MSEREMNAIADLIEEAEGAVKPLSKYFSKRAARLLAAVKEMKAATKEADGE